MTIQLSKHHGLGNDFLVLLDEVNGRAVAVTGAHARRWCNRFTGVGADGLLHGVRPDAGTDGDVDVVMRLYNSDGSRAEMSGNGIRCFGQAVAQARGIEAGTLRVRTDDGVKVLDIAPGDDPREMVVSVDMGAVRPGPRVPESARASIVGRHATVDLGNPHLVIEVPEPDEVDLAVVGGVLERQFPDGVNVEFVRADAPDHLTLVVWERGAGITRACGTGACAAVAAAHGWGAVGDDVTVSMPGGDARVVLRGGDQVTLVGPTATIATIAIDEEVGA